MPPPGLGPSSAEWTWATARLRASCGWVLVDHDRSLCAPHQPHDPEEVDDAHPEAIEDAIVRSPALARSMVHRHRDHLAALAYRQGREKAVHVIEAGQLEEEFPAKYLQAASGIGRAVAEERAAD